MVFSATIALKELVMSTVGSIIFNKNGDVTILTPLVDNRDLIKVLMRGGTAKVYGCDESISVWDRSSPT
jgi:conjugative transfer pilus assembly protein TraH